MNNKLSNNTLAIDTILGSNNILLVIPHAHREQTGDAISPMAVLGRSMADHLHCYTVINAKYKKSIVDMSDVRAIRKRKKITNDFLARIKQFKEEISANDRLPLIIILQVDAGGTNQDILFGYGQGERGRVDRPHRPTMSPSLLSKIRMSAEDQGFKTALAGTDSDITGRESYSINQLFRQKDFVDSFYDPTVRGVILTLPQDSVATGSRAQQTAAGLSNALSPFAEPMPLVRQISMDAVDTVTSQDLRYIFRVHGDNQYNDMIREAYIDELSRSIKRNGLLHPLVLLQKTDGRYKILCGFRRYQAIKRLNHQWVEAKVYNEREFTTEEFFNISLAENTKRRNLNPVEIGNFLESAARDMGLNNARLADQFGETLGIGKPGKKVSQSTIHKYRKINQIRERGESAEMISDVINDKLQFTIAAEVLAPIKDAEDRDALYLEVIKPLTPTRPQLLQITKLLTALNQRFSQAITTPQVQLALEKASGAKQKTAAFIRLLQQQMNKGQPEKLQQLFNHKVEQIREDIFGKKANKRDFNITSGGKSGKGALTLQVRLKEQSLEGTINHLKTLLADKKQLQELLSLLE